MSNISTFILLFQKQYNFK